MGWEWENSLITIIRKYNLEFGFDLSLCDLKYMMKGSRLGREKKEERK